MHQAKRQCANIVASATCTPYCWASHASSPEHCRAQSSTATTEAWSTEQAVSACRVRAAARQGTNSGVQHSSSPAPLEAGVPEQLYQAGLHYCRAQSSPACRPGQHTGCTPTDRLDTNCCCKAQTKPSLDWILNAPAHQTSYVCPHLENKSSTTCNRATKTVGLQTKQHALRAWRVHTER